MSKLLVLYDTREKDLARDIADFLRELGCEVTLMPQAPDLGKTLQEKESHYFNSVDGVVFLLTPGVDRGAATLPSPSVADEMGQARRLFDKKPERVIYLVDDRCTPHSIDQRAYIGFTHDKLRSIIDALTRLLRNLKAAGLVGQRPPEAREAPSVDIPSVSKATDKRLKDICELMSQLPNGAVEHQRFRELLKMQYQMSDQDVNFAERDLQTHGLVAFQRSLGPPVFGFFVLTAVGWELVRHEKASAQNVQNWLGCEKAATSVEWTPIRARYMRSAIRATLSNAGSTNGQKLIPCMITTVGSRISIASRKCARQFSRIVIVDLPRLPVSAATAEQSRKLTNANASKT